MAGIYDDPEQPEPAIRPEAILASEIIRLALVDSRSVDPALRQDALQFLADVGGALTFWCSICGLSPETVLRLAGRVLAEGRGARREVGQPRLLKRA